MDIEIFAVCDFSQDMGSKQIIIGTFDTIFAQKLPASHPSLYVCSRIRFMNSEMGNHSFDISISDPNCKNLTPTLNGNIFVQALAGMDSSIAHINLGINMLEFKIYGRHSITLSIDGKEMRTLPLFITRPPNIS